MDPLSITASILAIVGAGGTIGKILKKTLAARRLPEILLQLNNEVTDLQYVVQDVDDVLRLHARTIEEDQGLLPSSASLTSALEHAKQSLLALESLIAYNLTTVDSRDGTIKINRISWLRVESKMKDLIENIRTDRIRLSSALSLLASSSSLELHGQMRRLCFKLETANVQDAQPGEHFMGSHGGQTLVLRDSQQAVISQPLNEHNDSQVSQTVPSLEVSEAASKVDQIESPQSNDMVIPYPLKIETTRSLCEHNCNCICHQMTRIKSPWYLNAMFGSLWIGYSARPWSARPCDSTDCQGHLRSFSYTYVFPRWLLNRMMLLRTAYDQSRGPELCIRLVRVRSEDAGIFDAAKAISKDAGIHEIQRLLKHGEASVLDVDQNGLNALQYAIEYYNFDIAAFLIQAGSDIYQENSQGLCAYTLWWQVKLVERACRRESCNTNVPNLLGDQPHLPLFGFPPLSRAYFASSRRNFNNVLSLTPRSAIDDVDASGRTALAWAVRCSDWNSVNQLLLCGSDPNRVDSNGQAPLHIAARMDDVAIIQSLLAAKADITSKDIDGRTALHEASRQQGGITSVESLLSGGASIESQDDEGRSPLHFAVVNNEPTNVQFLLERGANINAASKRGITVLMYGVMHKSHEALRLLLRNEALKYDVKDIYGYSVLEYAAVWGDVETIRLLQSAPQMMTLNLDNSEALGHAVWRRDSNEAWSSQTIAPPDKDPIELFSAFKALWDTIADAQQRDRLEDPEAGFIEGELTDDEEEPVVWEDAQEDLDHSVA